MENIAKSPAKVIEEFLNAVDLIMAEYKYAYDGVGEEEKVSLDLLHELEFAKDKQERNKVATKLQHCRKRRREYKDLLKRDEQLAHFFDDPQKRKFLNELRKLLGSQRKEEDYLNGERHYKPRAGRNGKNAVTQVTQKNGNV